MNFNELHPIIQNWSESDEFIDSLVSVTTEFDLISSSPLLEAVFNLFTKEIKPEEFKEKLLASLPENERNEAIVNRLVNLSLLPIKGPLFESGIDISIIAPLDESSALPFAPVSPHENSAEEGALAPIEIPPISSITEPVISVGSPVEIESPVSSALQNSPLPEASPVSPSTAENLNAPLSIPTEIISPVPPVETLNKEEIKPEINLAASSPLVSPNFDSSAKEASPFVIHQEKAIERATASDSYVNNPLRPVFYPTETETKESPSFASLEFGKSDKDKKIDPANIVDLKDLPL